MNGRRILVTGPTGFVGRGLLDRLTREGWLIRAAVRSADRAALLPTDVEAAVVGPIGPLTDWRPVLSGIDVVVHLAARAHVMNDPAGDPLAAYREVNAAGTECLAHAAVDAGIERFVFMSSVKVNGEGAARPYTETDPPDPADAYGLTKLEAETALAGAAREAGMAMVVLRPPLVYGPGVKANFLNLLRAVDRGLPLPLASVDNRRSLIYLGNLVDVIMTCLVHEKAAGKTYLVSDGEDVSTAELIRKMAAALGRPARLWPVPPILLKAAGRLTGRSASIDRLLGSNTVDASGIRSDLDWRPPHDMADGLEETARWFKGL
ncbi:MAG: SDR family oxidoreductase [Proteobacteria bacterium]|nr:SDR family oxidoreductase [Pseudomonadota bacterium]